VERYVLLAATVLYVRKFSAHLPSLQSLINLVIEQLECMKPTSKANYDYVVLQATDNSIPFYEAMGFVRVGAVMIDEVNVKLPAVEENDEESETSPFVTSKVLSYKAQNGETLTRIAAKFEVDVWDLIFLNKHIIGEALPSSKPKLSTLLLIPDKPQPEIDVAQPIQETKWYTTNDNDTPRMIAKMCNVSCLDIVNGNKARLPGLMSCSRLKEGTKVKISNFDSTDKEYTSYAHWSFPDSEYEEPEPSYMMVRKLQRRKGAERNERPFEESLKAQITSYESTPLLLPPSPQRPPRSAPTKSSGGFASSVARPPKRPLSAYMLFTVDQRKFSRGKASGESTSVRDLWNELPLSEREDYEAKAKAALEAYKDNMAKYEAEHNSDNHGSDRWLESTPISAGDTTFRSSLYNKVVRLRPGAITEGSEYTYWYVANCYG
jgi:HMG (high mobility group) box/LysM domain